MIITGSLWKIATGVAAVVTIILAGFLVSAQIENRSLINANAKLDQKLTDNRADLAQSRLTAVTLKSALDKQNIRFKTMAAESARLLADVKRELAVAQAENRRATAKLEAFLSIKPQGATLEARILDVDKRVLENLK